MCSSSAPRETAFRFWPLVMASDSLMLSLFFMIGSLVKINSRSPYKLAFFCVGRCYSGSLHPYLDSVRFFPYFCACETLFIFFCTRMRQSVSVCLEMRAHFCLCKRKKKKEPASWLSFGLFVGICFCLHSGVGCHLQQGTGSGRRGWRCEETCAWA